MSPAVTQCGAIGGYAMPSRRFARGLVDALGPSARSTQRGTVWWIRTMSPTQLSTGFHLDASAAADRGITAEDVIARCTTAEAATEIDKVDLTWLDGAADLIMVDVRWNRAYLARPWATGRSAAIGTFHFGLWPLPVRIRRWTTRPTGVAVIVAVAAVVLLAVASLTPSSPPSQPPSPYLVSMPAAPTVAGPVSHLLGADQLGADACSLRRAHQPDSAPDPCDLAGVNGDRYFFEFTQPKVITAVALDPAALKPDRAVRKVIWLFNGDPENGYPATERVQAFAGQADTGSGPDLINGHRAAEHVRHVAPVGILHLDDGVRASKVTMVLAAAEPLVDVDAPPHPARGGATAITLYGHDTAP